jgi:hypothetical protein
MRVPEHNRDNIKTGPQNPPGKDLIVCEQALGTSERKLSSMLELGRLIGLDLNLDEMLIQIASKAKEVMDADRFNLLLWASRDTPSTRGRPSMSKMLMRTPGSSATSMKR